MLQTIVRVCQIAFFALGALTLGWFLVGKLSGERRREMNPFERTCAERAVALVVDEIPRRDAIKRLLVLPVRGDYDERITDMLVDRMAERPEYDVIDARKYAVAAPPTDWKSALELTDKLRANTRADGVLYTNVDRVTPREGVGTRIDMEARLVPLVGKEPSALDSARRLAAVYFPSIAPADQAETAGESVHPPPQEIRSRASVDWWAAEMEQTSRLLKLAVWALVVGALPFALFPVVQAITRRESSQWNAAMLAGMAAVNMTAALVLLGLRTGFFGFLLIVLAGLAGFVYDFVICDKIDEMRK